MADEKPLGTVRLKVSGDVSSCSANGREYTVDKKGFVFVRPEDVSDLTRMGLIDTTE